MLEKLTLARELTGCLCGIEVHLVSDADGSLNAFIRDTLCGSILTLASDHSITKFLSALEPECVYLLSGILDLCYIVIRLPRGGNFLFAGPCRMDDFSETRIRSTLRPHKLTEPAVRQIISYCRWQPVLSGEKLHQLGIILGRHVLNLPDPIRHRQIEYHWNPSDPPVPIIQEPYTDQSRIRQIEMRYEASAALTEAVKQGNLSLALQMIRGIQTGTTSMIRSPDPLRNAQNLCIILNTQLRHAMEQRKIHPYWLDRISGDIARQIEALKSLHEVEQFYGQIVRRYCELALEQNDTHLDSLTRQAVIYIKTHLTDNLTVKNTADALLVNANYLSGKFHREMGMTFIDFVNRQRTEQAAALLRRTNMQIQQIAAAVGYNNTSYFAKQFLRFHGLTPREYRSRGIL